MSFSISWDDVSEKADCAEISDFFTFEHDSLKSIRPDSLVTHTFVQGDNYPALKFLLSSFKEKVDFIYIDPPYNTGKKSFVYNDAFTVDSWLSFMKRRLELAKTIMADSGCIFIAIGQEELFRLKLLCDQIFGEENFINDFMWLHGKGKKDTFSRTMQQSTLCYAKNRKNLLPFLDYEFTDWAKSNPDDDKRGPWFSGSISFSEKRSNPKHENYYEITSPSGKKWKRQWLIKKTEMDSLISNNKIYWGKAPDYDNVPRRKIFNGEKSEIIPKNIIDSTLSTRAAQGELDLLLGEKNAFDNPKPVSLIQHFLQIVNMKKDITVLDFFAGSGTTFEAVVRQNEEDKGSRRCIIIQKPELIEKTSAFSTISGLCYERIKKVLPQTDGLNYYCCLEK
ncbi:MAG: site-specific DNA-methyltransferase [Treponema sp.]|nr:site-specific DNA-methyltransferase [Treponema sp.]